MTKARTTGKGKAQAVAAKTDQRFEAITADIIKRIESGAADPNGWRMPWNSLGTNAPRNIVSRKRYNGMNHLLLSLAAMEADGPALFGTFKQWEAKGLRRLSVAEAGPGFMVVRVVPIIKRDKAGQPVIDAKTGRADTFPVMKVFVVHGIWQMVDAEGHEGARAKLLDRFGYNADGSPVDQPTGPEADAKADAFFAALGANVVEHGDRAYYGIKTDHIQLPPRAAFKSSVAYYSTKAHEHTHWTGAASRLGRPGIVGFDHFGSEQYAFEELIAELGAAFVGSTLGFNTEARADHADYLAHWLTKLRSDSRALMHAASQAEAAATWMIKRAGLDVGDDAIADDDDAADEDDQAPAELVAAA